jgi:hypothetical protein
MTDTATAPAPAYPFRQGRRIFEELARELDPADADALFGGTRLDAEAPLTYYGIPVRKEDIDKASAVAAETEHAATELDIEADRLALAKRHTAAASRTHGPLDAWLAGPARVAVAA